MACGAWVAGSVLDFKAGLFGAVFGAEGAEGRLPAALSRLVHLGQLLLPSHTLVGAQLLGPSPRRSSWLPLSSQRRAATERAVVSDCPELPFASLFQGRQRLCILETAADPWRSLPVQSIAGPAASAAPVVPATIAAAVLPGPGHPLIDCPNFSSRSLDARPGADLGVATGWLEREVVGTECGPSLAGPGADCRLPFCFGWYLAATGCALLAPSSPAVLLLAPSGLYLLLGYLRGLGLAPSSSASCASPIWVEAREEKNAQPTQALLISTGWKAGLKTP